MTSLGYLLIRPPVPPSSSGELKAFIDRLNINQIGLRFTYELHEMTLTFLDIRISKKMHGTLETTIFKKPTATNNLLRWESWNPGPKNRDPKGLTCGSEEIVPQIGILGRRLSI